MAEELTNEEVWVRAQEIFTECYACWPAMHPLGVIESARKSYEADELCRLDYYAIASALLLLVASSPSDNAGWPPKTPPEFAEGMKLAKRIWPKVVDGVRAEDRGVMN